MGFQSLPVRASWKSAVKLGDILWKGPCPLAIKQKPLPLSKGSQNCSLPQNPQTAWEGKGTQWELCRLWYFLERIKEGAFDPGAAESLHFWSWIFSGRSFPLKLFQVCAPAEYTSFCTTGYLHVWQFYIPFVHTQYVICEFSQLGRLWTIAP